MVFSTSGRVVRIFRSIEIKPILLTGLFSKSRHQGVAPDRGEYILAVCVCKGIVYPKSENLGSDYIS